MKYVYVLVSGIEDSFYEQTLVSIISLRSYMPKALITVIVDNLTDTSLINDRSKIKEMITELVVINLDEAMKPIIRSRHLKTSMRNLIDGDFLYIDSDTVITADLSSIFEINYEIGAVSDLHTKMSKSPVRNKIYRLAKILNFSYYENDDYFNSGVLYVRDTSKTRIFFKRWNELWNYSTTKGIYFDQPAFAQTNYEFGYFVNKLSDEWNCQVAFGINCLSNARIIHIFHMKDKIHLLNKELYYDIKRTHEVSDYIMNIIQNAKTSFYSNTQIIDALHSEIMHTNVFHFIRNLFEKCHSVFSLLDWCTGFALKVIKRIN